MNEAYKKKILKKSDEILDDLTNNFTRQEMYEIIRDTYTSITALLIDLMKESSFEDKVMYVHNSSGEVSHRTINEIRRLQMNKKEGKTMTKKTMGSKNVSNESPSNIDGLEADAFHDQNIMLKDILTRKGTKEGLDFIYSMFIKLNAVLLHKRIQNEGEDEEELIEQFKLLFLSNSDTHMRDALAHCKEIEKEK